MRNLYIVVFTGELDEATKKVMTTPRCGNKDFHSKSSSRHKRFALMGKYMIYPLK